MIPVQTASGQRSPAHAREMSLASSSKNAGTAIRVADGVLVRAAMSGTTTPRAHA